VIFLDIDDLLHTAERVLGSAPLVSDPGLLQSALGRPQASAFGTAAYPSIHSKTAALLHSLARNHGLVDGNKRLALAGVVAFYGLNGRRLRLSNETAYDLVTAVARGELDDVDGIAAALEQASQHRR
jgi:death on curing protein